MSESCCAHGGKTAEIENAARNGEQLGRTFSPRADLVEGKDALYITLDVPGATEQGLDIHVEKGVLTVQARMEPASFQNHRLALREHSSGTYTRKFSLAEGFDIDKIQARLKNGQLSLELPKSEKAKPRKVAVKVEASS